MNRILLAVDDSPAGLAAARVAIGLAVQTSAEVRAIQVLPDGELSRALHDQPRGVAADDRRSLGAQAVLRYVTDLAARSGVSVGTVMLSGQPARCILHEAATWPADVVVLGRAGDRHVGQPYVGSDVRHVLEFADVPVLVVPGPRRAEVQQPSA